MFSKKSKTNDNKNVEAIRKAEEDKKKKEREELTKKYNDAKKRDNLVKEGKTREEAEKEVNTQRKGIEVEIASTTKPQALKTNNTKTSTTEETNEKKTLVKDSQAEVSSSTEVKKTLVKKSVVETSTTSKEKEEVQEVKETKTKDKKPKVMRPEVTEEKESDKIFGKYEIYEDSDGFRYRLVASNGQIMAVSEVYTTSRGAKSAIDTLKSNLDTLQTTIETDKHRKSQFVCATQQNKVLVHGANYTTRTQAQSAYESFKKLVPTTRIFEVKESSDSKPELVDRSKFLKEDGKGKYLIVVSEETNAYQFVLKASNGQVIVTSKQYKSVLSCKSAIAKFRQEVKEGTFYTIKDKNGQYQFRLYSSANKLVQSGISYSSKAKCLSNIESICRFIDSDIIEK